MRSRRALAAFASASRDAPDSGDLPGLRLSPLSSERWTICVPLRAEQPRTAPQAGSSQDPPANPMAQPRQIQNSAHSAHATLRMARGSATVGANREIAPPATGIDAVPRSLHKGELCLEW